MATELATRPPAFVDGKTLSANDLRLAVLSGSGGATPLQSRAGVRPSGGSPGLVAALVTPVMKVRVNAGIADVPSASVTGGFYRVSWDQVDLDIDPSSAQARTDLIIVEVVDTGTSAATGKVRVLKGTSGAGRPTNPVVNAHWFSLAATAVRVNAEGTGNIRPQDVTPEHPFAVAPGARIPVRNQDEQDALTAFKGLEVYRLDNGQVQLCTAAGPPAVWAVTYDPTDTGVWTAFTPTWTSSGAVAPAIGNGTLTGRYRRVGKTVEISIVLTFGSTTNGGSGNWSFGGLPAALASREQLLQCKAFTAAGNLDGFGLLLGGATVTPYLPSTTATQVMAPVRNADASTAAGTGIPTIAGTFPFANGNNLVLSGSYEAA